MNNSRSVTASKIIFGLMFLFASLALNASQALHTAGGKLQLKDIDDYGTQVVLNGKTLWRDAVEHISVEHTYQTPKSTIVLMSAYMGGNGTVPSYRILEIWRNGHYALTDTFFSDDETFRYSFSSRHKKLVIDLGYEKGLRKYAVYQNSKLHVYRKHSRSRYAKERDCRYLYEEIYLRNAQESRCLLNPFEINGLSSESSVATLGNDPRINTQTLKHISQHACQNHYAIPYRSFREKVCKRH